MFELEDVKALVRAAREYLEAQEARIALYARRATQAERVEAVGRVVAAKGALQVALLKFPKAA